MLLMRREEEYTFKSLSERALYRKAYEAVEKVSQID